MSVIRVFPRRTKASPVDPFASFGPPGLFDYSQEIDEVHVSVAFTWDIPKAEQLAREWEKVAPVKIGGPAYGKPSGHFCPGIYLKRGYIITSRGCPNRCWFCSVWRREGGIRELPVRDGWIVQDDNLLACSDAHIEKVFAMLARQKKYFGRRIEFTGGLEAARLKDWHIDRLWALRPKQMFFAYDTPDDLDPLHDAGRRLLKAGWTRRGKILRCYVLCGHPRDTFDAAELRMRQTIDAGFWPMAMLWRDDDGKKNCEWAGFQRRWSRPAITYSLVSLQE